MPQICTVCKHPKTREIEQQILSGRSVMSIAKEYGLSEMSIHNHKNNHLSPRMVKVYNTKEALADFNMMDEFNDLIEKIKRQIERLERKEAEGLTIAATNTLIKLYGVMSQFASVYYQKQTLDRETNQEEQAQREAEEFQNSLSILTLEELKMLNRLSNKIEKQDATIVIIPDTQPFSCLDGYDYETEVQMYANEDKPMTGKMKRTKYNENKRIDELLELQVKML